MDTEQIAVADVYVPVKMTRAVDWAKVETVAEQFIDTGHMTPIRVRRDGARFVLVNGLHRLEACKALGEETIEAFVVRVQH